MAAEKFDLRTSIIDPSTGAVVKHQPYIMKVDKAKGTMFERPPGSGNYFYPNNEPVPKEQPVVAPAPVVAAAPAAAPEPVTPAPAVATPASQEQASASASLASPKGQAKAKQQQAPVNA